jgi:adenosylmethionine-8-amino-7-oxononanoate aminotransferase
LISPSCKSSIEAINKSLENFKVQLSGFSVIKDVRVCGTILAIELMTNDTSSYYNPIRKKIYSHFLSKGILVRPLGNVMYIVPPYIISMGELQSIQSEIAQFVRLISGEISS